MLHKGIRNCSNVKYVTIVRQPIERILSHCSFEKIPLTAALKIAEGDLKPHPHNIFRHRAQFNNFFIRTLLGEDVFHLPTGQVTEAHLVRAMRFRISALRRFRWGAF